MKVIFLTKYDRLAANTRYRCLQYLPFLRNEGLECEVSPLLGDEYLRHRFESGRFKIQAIVRAYINRLRLIVRLNEYDLVVLHYELFPYFPAVFERLLKFFDIRYICDYDDATFSQYENHPNPLIRFFLGDKIKKVIHYSAGVFAGNTYLASYAHQVSKNISIIPTVVDPKRYRRTIPHAVTPDRPFTIGWIGSPSTANYLGEVAIALRRFCLKYNAQVVLVGSGKVNLPGVPTQMREWSEATEQEELAKFDVGIMPLPDNPWTRGKCGFKLIQYMACSLPTVASPVGANCDLVENGETGFLASTQDDWVEALEKLYESQELRRTMGEKGYKKILEEYSLSVFAPQLVELIKESVLEMADFSRSRNIDFKVTKGFGEEWAYFKQNLLSDTDLRKIFLEYFEIFPWEKLPPNAVGADIGCGSGRWARFVAPLVSKLHCLDASEVALEVAKKHLSSLSNVEFHHKSIGEMDFEKDSLDFAYCVGVLHHLPDPAGGIRAIASKLKPGAPFLFYIYYAFENRGPWYQALWRFTDVGRVFISRMPFKAKFWISQLLAMLVYWPLARSAKVLDSLGILPQSWALSYYKDKAFYVMRNDALDRFGTRVEKRFTREEIQKMLEEAGFNEISFSPSTPYWVGVATKGWQTPINVDS